MIELLKKLENMKKYNGQNITYDKLLITIKMFGYMHTFLRINRTLFINRKFDLFHRKCKF